MSGCADVQIEALYHFDIHDSIFGVRYLIKKCFSKPLKNSKAPDGQGPLLTNYKPKL
jgi:hypothetical protein